MGHDQLMLKTVDCQQAVMIPVLYYPQATTYMQLTYEQLTVVELSTQCNSKLKRSPGSVRLVYLSSVSGVSP